MEKLIVGFPSAILASIVSCLLLLSIDYWVLSGGKHGVTLLVNHFAVSINTQKPDFLNSTTLKSNETAIISSNSVKNRTEVKRDSCSGRYIYVHDLPSRFNDDVIKDCRLLVKWYDICPYMVNSGLGPQVINNSRGVLLPNNNSWFSTNQFLLEVIFRDRIKRYKCLTNDSSIASVIFVPFYAGFDVGRYLWDYNVSMRDSLGHDLAKWLAGKPEWKKMWGRDHFFVAGRIAWDFRRIRDDDSEWGSNLMYLPEFMNTTMLSIETGPWSNEFSIPYPTYFHPSSDNEVLEWQNRVKNRKRRYLFCFAGAPRPNMQGSIRGEIIKQCLASRKKCKLMDCKSPGNRCNNPVEVMKVFQDSVFCLQPPGDSYTRRSIFDSILAGCIPVFFHPASAYTQYTWYFPMNYTKYSLFIPQDGVKVGKVSIKKTLSRVRKNRVLAMREEVVRLIPKIIYANPASGLQTLEDAFDVAVNRVLERVEKVRRDIKEGKDPGIGFADWNGWKIGGEHEWDRLLDR